MSDNTVITTTGMYAVLANERRRYVLRSLREYRTPRALADLPTEVARQEYNAPLAKDSSDGFTRLSLSLDHVHFPKLADARVIQNDPGRNLVSRGQQADQIGLYPAPLAIEAG